MRVIFIFLLALVTTTQAQQINPVPDYIFRNQMSVGRNAVTDTAAYMSIGPRYGANKGLMPPIVVDTLTVTASPKRNGLLIFSVQKNKYVYWDSVRVQWSDMAGSSGSYIKGSGTITYIPKFTDSITLGNSAMYDSSGFVRLYKNNIGNVFNHNDQNPVAGLTLVKDGVRGYPMIIQQNDSITNNIQLALLLRKGLLTSDTVRPGYGVGIEMNLQDNTRQWRRSGWIINNIVDSTIGTFKSEMATMVRNGANFIYPLIVRPDSTIRVLKLSGSGVRNVVADANGDLSIGSATNSVDTLSIATRAWRQKGDDSLGAIIATKQNTLTNPVTGTGTTNYIPKFTGTSTIGNSIISESGSDITIAGNLNIGSLGNLAINAGSSATPLLTQATNYTEIYRRSGGVGIYLGGTVDPANYYDNDSHFFRGAGAGATRMRIFSTGNLLVGTGSDAGYKLDVAGTLRSTLGANFATTSGDVGIGNTAPSEKLHVTGRIRATTIDSTATAMNMLYADETGVIKKAPAGTGGITGTGITGYFPKWTGTSSQDTSQIFQSGANIIVGGSTSNGNYKFQVNGNAYVQSETMLGATGDLGVYTLQVTGESIFDGAITTQQPGGSIATKIPWRLGNVATVTPTSPNRTISVEINGTTYYIHAKTTND